MKFEIIVFPEAATVTSIISNFRTPTTEVDSSFRCAGSKTSGSDDEQSQSSFDLSKLSQRAIGGTETDGETDGKADIEAELDIDGDVDGVFDAAAFSDAELDGDSYAAGLPDSVADVDRLVVGGFRLLLCPILFCFCCLLSILGGFWI